MQHINYDFKNLITDIDAFKNTKSNNELTHIKNELNKFFSDSTCNGVIYTENTDKLFFGMCVMPIVNGDTAVKILTSSDKIRINSYYVEFDSRLFSTELSLSAREILAILLHEIGHLVNDSSPVDEVRKAVDTYAVNNGTHISITNSVQYRELLAFALKDSLRKLTSIFTQKKNEEVLADEFVVRCGFGPELESAFNKITKRAMALNRDVDNKLIVLQWALRLYLDIKTKRIPAIHALKRAKQETGSSLEGREITWVSNNLNQIDEDAMITESYIEDLVRKVNTAYRNFKIKGLRSLEDDIFDIALRIKNCDEQDEALAILREINTNLSILDDFLRTENLDDNTKKRVFTLIDKYEGLRDELSRKKTYKDKYYGLFVKTPVIQNRYVL